MKPNRWLLGISGGIAAYKTPALIRLLKKRNLEVQVVLSQGACSFVSPLVLQSLSERPVYQELLDVSFETAMGHIELARWAQAVLITPLSANRLAALAHGMADDLLTTLCLATQAPIWVAPAMNKNMWEHPATHDNINVLKERGVNILGPEWGEQACKEVGIGRMLEPEQIVQALFEPPLLNEIKVLITAGPTHEAIDPVRFLSNRSSGKMGFALAQAALDLGARVTLIAGPVSLPTPCGVKRIDVISAQEMLQATLQEAPKADIFIANAAVSDFYAVQAPQKIKKRSPLSLELLLNVDILATVAKENKGLFCVGFAAETEQLAHNAKIKLNEKQLDLIALNDISQPGVGFDSQDNALTVYSVDREYHLSKAPKYQVALQLLKIIKEHYHAKNSIKNP